LKISEINWGFGNVKSIKKDLGGVEKNSHHHRSNTDCNIVDHNLFYHNTDILIDALERPIEETHGYAELLARI
jgi:hypothetical protein